MTDLERRILSGILVGISIACASSGPVDGQSPTPVPTLVPASVETPLTVFVSDLHFGFGKTAGRWSPLDDFRWSNALKGFLDEISRESSNQTTLVVVGDFFEMWQHPGVLCGEGDADHGCTVGEMEEVARKIVEGHRGDLQTLGAFATRGANRLVVIPGNHDAALLLPSVWAIVFPVLGAPAGRIELVKTGVWVSRRGDVVAEHGHQMPLEDVNGYKTWPRVTSLFHGREFMIRPWGERFVHGLYNRVEDQYSLIDNLIPQSNGLRHYFKDQGFVASALDVARFVAFNLTQTSLSQLGALGEKKTEGPPPWDVDKARETGWKLFARALPKDDWYRLKLEGDNSDEWTKIRRDLDSLARDNELVSTDEVRSLCDRASVISPAEAERCPREKPTLGVEIYKGVARGARLRALRSHLKTRKIQVPGMQVFIYGHTHELQCPNPITPEGYLAVTVANTGAFQRLADDGKFTRKATEMGLTPARALRQLTVNDLPACYSAVLVTYRDGDPVVSVKSWLMEETATTGQFVDPTDCRCAKLGSACDSSATCP